MSDPSYPEGLPYKPRRGEWSISRPDPLASDMEGANKRLRARAGDKSVRIVTQTLRFTADQLTTFEAFVADDLAGGTARFTMQVWLGSDYQSKTVQFDGKLPAIGGRSVRVPVAMTLRVFGV
jgi:hypothetical protein